MSDVLERLDLWTVYAESHGPNKIGREIGNFNQDELARLLRDVKLELGKVQPEAPERRSWASHADLSPCPMCGDRARLRGEHDPDGIRWSYVQCMSCGLRTRGNWSTDPCPQFYEEVRDEWNQRVQGDNASLVDALDHIMRVSSMPWITSCVWPGAVGPRLAGFVGLPAALSVSWRVVTGARWTTRR